MDNRVGIATSDTESIAVMVLNIPANDDRAEWLTPKLPRRLRRRLLEVRTPMISAQDIESKLHQAYLRRQKFYNSLSSKALPKSIPRCSSFQEKYLYLQAKHNAAEHKRLTILAQIQNRLAKLDQSRQNAKNGLQMRFLKERDELSAKVESRMRQAAANRTRLLNACRQRQVSKRENALHSLTRKQIQQKMYKESIRTAMHQKCAAAERKRLGILEAQRFKARASSLEVHKAAQSREIERKKLQNQLEGRIQRGKRFTTESLRKMGSSRNSGQESPDMVKQKKLVNRIIRCWRQFTKLKGTMASLAKAFTKLKINQKSVKSMPFERLAMLLESGDTIRIVKALLYRLASRIIIRQETKNTNNVFHMESIDHLLKRVAIPAKRVYLRDSSSNITLKRARSGNKVAQKSTKLSRYPVRVVLGAYIISGHPDVVSAGMKKYETGLVRAAEEFSLEFELLIKIMLEGPIHSSEESCALTVSQLTFSSQLAKFDKAWCSYLHQFVTWKVKDAKLLEGDLVRAASQLEITRHNYKKMDEDCVELTNKKTVLDQVAQPQTSGIDDLEHVESVLSDKPSEFMIWISSTSMPDRITLPSLSGLSAVSTSNETSGDDNLTKIHRSAGNVIQSMFKQEKLNSDSTSSVFPSPSKKTDDHHGSDQMSAKENVMIVNELVHGHSSSLTESSIVTIEDKGSIKSRMRDTMEKAFWDGIMETLKQDTPDYSWVLKLIKEVRDELCELSPSSWSQEIDQTIDLDILSQVFQMGTSDFEYCGRILEFSLVTLQKLCAPARENELKTAHQKLLMELAEISKVENSTTASFALVVMRGLRFVLEQIQTLKHEISKARMSMLEPFIKGTAGLEYLRNSFANHYGSPSDEASRLPVVTQWISSVLIDSERNWAEHLESLSAAQSRYGEYSPVTLRAGGSVLRVSPLSAPYSLAGTEQPECKGEKLDLLLRLGLLKLIIAVEGLTAESLPETLQLNLFRLRTIQSRLQTIIVICTSILVLRQTLISEHLVTSAADTENAISDCVKRLSETLDSVKDVGITEIVEIMNCCYPNNAEEGTLKNAARKNIMSNMLGKSLSAGDSVFVRVSRSVYLAARGIMLGGSGVQGKQLAEMELKRIGAGLLTEKLVDAVEGLVVMVNISKSVHFAWYEQVLRNI